MSSGFFATEGGEKNQPTNFQEGMFDRGGISRRAGTQSRFSGIMSATEGNGRVEILLFWVDLLCFWAYCVR